MEDGARSICIEYPGAFYHVMTRGIRREAIFLDDNDRRFFPKALKLWKEGLAAAGRKKRDLPGLPGSDARQVAIARQTWDTTTVSMKWISDHMAMKGGERESDPAETGSAARRASHGTP
jgi:hypothetical protein